MASHDQTPSLLCTTPSMTIPALRSTQIAALVKDGDLELGLFDQRNLAQISSPKFPGERLVAYLTARETTPCHAADYLLALIRLAHPTDGGRPGLERQPEREDLARKLRTAYLETGQHGRAAEIQKAHALEA